MPQYDHSVSRYISSPVEAKPFLRIAASALTEAHAARRVESLAITLVMATRPVDTRADSGILSDLLGEQGIVVLRPPALDEDAVATHLHGIAAGPVDEAFSRQCHHASGGNPFLLVELVRTLRERRVPFTAAGVGQIDEITPPQVARATRTRLAQLDHAPAALARAIGVLGDEAPLDLACEIAGVGVSDGALSAQALVSAGLLEPDRLLRFRHPLIRSAVATTVTPFERDVLHRRAAALLRARGAPVERVAVHVMHTLPGDDGAFDTLRAAAKHAVSRGAPDVAVPLLRRALEEPIDPTTRAVALLELGFAEERADLRRDAVTHLGEAARLASDPLTRCEAILSLAGAVGPLREVNRDLLPLVNAALDDAASLDRERRLMLETALLHAHWYSFSELDQRGQRIAAELASLAGDTPGECIALSQTLERRRMVADAHELSSIALRVARHAPELLARGSQAGWVHGTALVLRWTDQLDAADRLVADWIETATRQGSSQAFMVAISHRAGNNRARGRLREAEADASAAAALAAPESIGFTMTNLTLVSALRRRGELDAAEAVFRALGFGEQIPPLRPFVGVLLTRMNLHVERGRHAEALADFEEAARRSGGLRTGPLLEDWLLAIESTHALGDHEGAGQQLDDAIALARWWGTDSAIGAALRVRGRLAGSRAEAIGDLRAATEHLERSPRRYEHACALVDLGAALRRSGARTDSRDPLRSGYELARECGADRLAETARQELAASGVRVRRERLSGVESLTPSERRIANMAAEGNSNAQIAQSLFVTLKTVEMHLTHVYQKLDITGRSDLKRVLAR